ncbi:hypothetical protein DFH06DRAFT_1399910 [Mycena polygramma]|nr:hypothetical protein DFH06DRAFT_1399910 [Mycena polygramma]
MCAPVERPPDEVLALIFKMAADRPLWRGESPLPLTISRVSERWRAVALSSPEIWTTIRISSRRPIDEANLFLERSSPLRFRLSVNTEHRTRPIDLKSLLDVLRPHMQRCAALALCLSDEDMCTWTTVFGSEDTLHTLQSLSMTIHSYAPDELWGPPHSMFLLINPCTALRSLRLSSGPTMHLQNQLHALQLTTLDVRCTWDGAFVRHVCRHSLVLETLVLRDYSASVFDNAAPACLPSLTSLVLEYRDAMLAEGLINLALFLDLPNLSHLTIKGSGIPDAGHSLRHWCPRALPRLQELHLDSIVFQRSIDISVLQSLSAVITHLQLINVHGGLFRAADVPLSIAYPNLRVLEIPRALPATTPTKVIIRDISPTPAAALCPEFDFYGGENLVTHNGHDVIVDNILDVEDMN